MSADFTVSGSESTSNSEKATVSWIGCPNCKGPVMVVHFDNPLLDFQREV
jgi:hypothetical protein